MRKHVTDIPVDVEFTNDSGGVFAEFTVLFDVDATYHDDGVDWGTPLNIRVEGRGDDGPTCANVGGHLEVAIRTYLRSSGGADRIREELEERRYDD
ncbi:MAG: hypothetical protein EA420_16400 [Candidatus Competibacteraceae bacterium]|nr:MAG: hypothetical protein EA420_16400 [Candidatus Competibacteraceae bacterium]